MAAQDAQGSVQEAELVRAARGLTIDDTFAPRPVFTAGVFAPGRAGTERLPVGRHAARRRGQARRSAPAERPEAPASDAAHRVAAAQAEIRRRGTWNSDLGDLVVPLTSISLGRTIQIESVLGGPYCRVTEPLAQDRAPNRRALQLLHTGNHYDSRIRMPRRENSLYHAIARSAFGPMRSPEEEMTVMHELKTQLLLWLDGHREHLASWADLYGEGYQHPDLPPLGARVRATNDIDDVPELVPVIAANVLRQYVSVLMQGGPDYPGEVGNLLGRAEDNFEGAELDFTPDRQIGLYVQSDGHVDALRKMPGTGDCFFHAVLHQLRDPDYSKSDAVQRLRDRVAASVGARAEQVVDWLPPPQRTL